MSDLKVEDVSREDIPHEKQCVVQSDSDSTTQTDSDPRLVDSPTQDKPREKGGHLLPTIYYGGVNLLLGEIPKASHPVWASLKKQLKKTPESQMSNRVLFQQLEAACSTEELDWKKFDSVKRTWKDEPQMINSHAFSALLFKLMGSSPQKEQQLHFPPEDARYCHALSLDGELADSIYTFLALSKLAQWSKGRKGTSHLPPLLQSKFQALETRLVKNRGAPKVRQFIEEWGKTAYTSSESEDDNDEEDGE
ncbi:hypothetical protein Trihar35433_8920 [Trichoderma harzianum]|nr:hypothetical protein Trihar35433_8920 [Trichoderma harzianum]